MQDQDFGNFAAVSGMQVGEIKTIYQICKRLADLRDQQNPLYIAELCAMVAMCHHIFTLDLIDILALTDSNLTNYLAKMADSYVMDVGFMEAYQPDHILVVGFIQ